MQNNKTNPSKCRYIATLKEFSLNLNFGVGQYTGLRRSESMSVFLPQFSNLFDGFKKNVNIFKSKTGLVNRKTRCKC
jgi:hypothetical protein